jgi:hypothetical protein
MTDNVAAEEILAAECDALDRWSKGDAVGYFASGAQEVTYFDDIGAQTRIDGAAALQEYGRSLEGKIPPHRYELVAPLVQLYGGLGILSLGYRAFSVDGSPLTPWKATIVYRREGTAWLRVHAHWSIAKVP